MIIDNWLKARNLKLYPWAKSHGITPECITMYRTKKHRSLSARTIAKIIAATNGEVTFADIMAEIAEREQEIIAKPTDDCG